MLTGLTARLMEVTMKKTNFRLALCDVLRNLVPFAQFKKREKHPWKDVTFSKVAG